eukprot:Skav202060  [mRNA]  locus=scaffold1138:550298:555328:- [translate_table: standard]
MEFHLQVPAEKWCITKSEFFAFVEDVRQLWEEGRLVCTNSEDHTRYSVASSSTNRFTRIFQDEISGPNLYEVNEHFVKPVTRKAGGMSYALMKHPQGLLCEIFISHAWAEGVFELGDHVKRAWPRMQRMHNLYCCLLANPQNLDMSTWLDGPPAQSPFARLILVVLPLTEVHVKKTADAVFLLAFLMTVLCFGISPTFKLLKGKCPQHCIHMNMSVLRTIHVVLIFLLTLVAFPWALQPGPYFTPSEGDHYFILFGTWLFNVLRVTQLNEELLEDRELERQATNLDFTSLADATCSNQRDEIRIRLRKAFESGANIAGLGTTDLVVKTGVQFMLLWFPPIIAICAGVFLSFGQSWACIHGAMEKVNEDSSDAESSASSTS